MALLLFAVMWLVLLADFRVRVLEARRGHWAFDRCVGGTVLRCDHARGDFGLSHGPFASVRPSTPPDCACVCLLARICLQVRVFPLCACARKCACVSRA